MCDVYVMNPGAFISKRNGMVCIWQNHKLSKNIPIATLEGLVLMDKVQISSQLVAELLEKKIPIETIIEITGLTKEEIIN